MAKDRRKYATRTGTRVGPLWWVGEHQRRRIDGDTVQTFLPFPDLSASARALDRQRLGKQRLEAQQLLRTLRGESQGWKNHPACLMWVGYEDGLSAYLTVCILEWLYRGYQNSIMIPGVVPGYRLPPWFGDERLHRSHQSNLIRKLPEHYGPLFPGVPDNLPYFWPSKNGYLPPTKFLDAGAGI